MGRLTEVIPAISEFVTKPGLAVPESSGIRSIPQLKVSMTIFLNQVKRSGIK